MRLGLGYVSSKYGHILRGATYGIMNQYVKGERNFLFGTSRYSLKGTLHLLRRLKTGFDNLKLKKKGLERVAVSTRKIFN